MSVRVFWGVLAIVNLLCAAAYGGHGSWWRFGLTIFTFGFCLMKLLQARNIL